MLHHLHGHDKEVAKRIWMDLRIGKPDAYKELQAAPKRIREAIHAALMASLAQHKVETNPFGFD